MARRHIRHGRRAIRESLPVAPLRRRHRRGKGRRLLCRTDRFREPQRLARRHIRHGRRAIRESLPVAPLRRRHRRGKGLRSGRRFPRRHLRLGLGVPVQQVIEPREVGILRPEPRRCLLKGPLRRRVFPFLHELLYIPGQFSGRRQRRVDRAEQRRTFHRLHPLKRTPMHHVGKRPYCPGGRSYRCPARRSPHSPSGQTRPFRYRNRFARHPIGPAIGGERSGGLSQKLRRRAGKPLPERLHQPKRRSLDHARGERLPRLSCGRHLRLHPRPLGRGRIDPRAVLPPRQVLGVQVAKLPRVGVKVAHLHSLAGPGRFRRGRARGRLTH